MTGWRRDVIAAVKVTLDEFGVALEVLGGEE